MKSEKMSNLATLWTFVLILAMGIGSLISLLHALNTGDIGAYLMTAVLGIGCYWFITWNKPPRDKRFDETHYWNDGPFL